MSGSRPERREATAPPTAPGPAGPYSSAIVSGGFLFLAGQAAITPEGAIVRGTIEEQTEMTLANLAAVAEAAGADLRDAVKVTVYLTDIALWARMNTVYARWFDDPKPVRTVVACELNGFDVEIDAIVAVRS
ncbi:RidA family protein [Conexibacter arvalis]|uniref:2-iminobutanoate/2-iminopropanoate deaminase n=1 Tax=Conexibacter arvalis TaxID=912552 RepID=A0A840IGA6_9ACTN|nr:RidA family protein [Conexibacter arvalis]MBB4664067.1 2-iminobutanoate/2-iminopropanoate deaminase [Conexibacter arvalis]